MNVSPEFSRLVESILRRDGELSKSDEDLKDYIRLIMAIARPYVRTRVEYEDLVMQGVLGLLKAREKYDATRSPNFRTFASMCILGEIYAYCQSNVNLISIPTHISKASSYVDRMRKLLETSSGDTIAESDVEKIILEYNSELEDSLSPEVVKKLRGWKDRVLSIAKNSSLTYEALALLARRALVSVVSDALLCNYQTVEPSIESAVGEIQVQRMLLRSLGEKRYIVLRAHHEGYSNPEIAQILYEHGYQNFMGKPISRSAVKSLLDNTLTTIRNMEIFKNVGK